VSRAAEAVESFLDGEDAERIAAAINRASPGVPIPGTEDLPVRGVSRRKPSGRETRADVNHARCSVAKYEGMFLIDNSRVKPEPEACVGVVNDLLGRHQGKVVRTDRWDERKLAYEISRSARPTCCLTSSGA
jgi:hypothetical protein